jgi:mono/diheme cytochrome c family protein
MGRTGKAVLVLLTISMSGTVAAAWWIAGRGFSAKEEPTAIETFLARRIRSLATPKAAREAENPVARTDEVLENAMSHFADHCALCHANDGSGQTSIGQGLYPPPRDLRDSATQDLTDGELFYIIHNGIRLTGMPAFGQGPADQDTGSWELVHFIRHLPNISREELERMKTMNPKSSHELEEEEAIRRFLAGEDIQPSDQRHQHD